MPKKTDKKSRIRIYLLRNEGLTLDAIVDRLSKEFQRDDVPDRSTVSRLLKGFKAEVPPEMKEDIPFSWVETGNVIPWESSRALLNVFSYWKSKDLDNTYGQFTGRMAKWVWRVLNALKLKDEVESAILFGLSNDSDFREADSLIKETDVIGISQEYAWRELASTLFHEHFETADLDALLAFTPWLSQEHFDRYQEYLKREERFDCVIWHYRRMYWVESFKTLKAEKIRRTFAITQSQIREIEAIQDLLTRTDGLLDSQIDRYCSAEYEGDEAFSWWWNYLEQVIQDLSRQNAISRN